MQLTPLQVLFSGIPDAIVIAYVRDVPVAWLWKGKIYQVPVHLR
jgi:hypothetical protein